MPLTALQSFIMGVVQGLTEFLPISSSAHLILVPRFLNWPYAGLAFDVALHLGTLAGVVAYFWRDLGYLIESWVSHSNPRRQSDRNLVVYLAIATVPAAVIGYFLEKTVEHSLRSPVLAAWMLIGAGLLLGLADYLSPRGKTLREMSALPAFLIGLAQSVALIPGTSRSGITITAALFMGFARKEAARFSFLMSIPIIAGAGIMKIKDIWASPDHMVLFLGFLGAATSGFLAIWGLMKFVQSNRFTPFVIYRILLGIFILYSFA